MKPRLLDLCCCEGGAADGYKRAGFYVVGVDTEAQPNYAGDEFYRADALKFPTDGFSVVHASPPCQARTTMSNRWRGKGGLADERVNLIAPMRERLKASGLPWVLENVPGARRDLRSPMALTGEMFGLRVHRPRLFESNVLLYPPSAVRRQENPVAVYGANDQRRLWTRKDGSELRAASLEEAREAMGMPWASWDGLREAIPPAYAEWIGAQLMQAVKVAA